MSRLSFLRAVASLAIALTVCAFAAMELSKSSSAHLVISITPGVPTEPARSYTLICHPASGTLPGKDRACALLGLWQRKAAKATGAPCTKESLVAFDRVRVHGTIGGKPVTYIYSECTAAGEDAWKNIPGATQ